MIRNKWMHLWKTRQKGVYAAGALLALLVLYVYFSGGVTDVSSRSVRMDKTYRGPGTEVPELCVAFVSLHNGGSVSRPLDLMESVYKYMQTQSMVWEAIMVDANGMWRFRNVFRS